MAALKEAVEVKKNSSFSPVLSYITSGRMTAAKAIVLMAALKKAAGRPSVRPANEADANQISATEATALMEALKEAVEVKKTVQSSNPVLSRDRRGLSECSVVIKHRDFWDFLCSPLPGP